MRILFPSFLLLTTILVKNSSFASGASDDFTDENQVFKGAPTKFMVDGKEVLGYPISGFSRSSEQFPVIDWQEPFARILNNQSQYISSFFQIISEFDHNKPDYSLDIEHKKVVNKLKTLIYGKDISAVHIPKQLVQQFDRDCFPTLTLIHLIGQFDALAQDHILGCLIGQIKSTDTLSTIRNALFNLLKLWPDQEQLYKRINPFIDRLEKIGSLDGEESREDFMGFSDKEELTEITIAWAGLLSFSPDLGVKSRAIDFIKNQLIQTKQQIQTMEKEEEEEEEEEDSAEESTNTIEKNMIQMLETTYMMNYFQPSSFLEMKKLFQGVVFSMFISKKKRSSILKSINSNQNSYNLKKLVQMSAMSDDVDLNHQARAHFEEFGVERDDMIALFQSASEEMQNFGARCALSWINSSDKNQKLKGALLLLMSERFQSEGIAHLRNILSEIEQSLLSENIDLTDLASFFTFDFSGLPQSVTEEFVPQVFQIIRKELKATHSIWKQPLKKDPEQAELQKKHRNYIAGIIINIEYFLESMAPKMIGSDSLLKNEWQDLVLDFSDRSKFIFLPEECVKLLMMIIDDQTTALAKKTQALHELKKFILDNRLPLRFRSQALQKYKSYVGDLPSEKAFCEIAEHMFDFEYNLSGRDALVENVHDKLPLNKTNALLEKLLENEDPERRVLSEGQKDEMLIDILNILNHLSATVREVITEEDLQDAKTRINLMREAKACDANSTEGLQWFGTADPKQIVILDHNREKITQGRALQLAYDRLNKLDSSSKVYEKTLIDLIRVLASGEAMAACKEGSVGGLIRSTEASYEGDVTVAVTKFDQHDALREQLAQLKSFMISLLDHWKLDKKVFDKPITTQDYPMLTPEFISLIQHENFVFSQFLKDLSKLNWSNLLKDRGPLSLYQLFQKSETSETEKQLIEDLNVILVVPAMRAFIYGQYKPFLMNDSLNVQDYVTIPDDFQVVESADNVQEMRALQTMKRYWRKERN